jgi:hypothetical protein
MTTIRKELILSACIAVSFSCSLCAQSATTIAGKWKAENDPDQKSEFYLAKDNFYYAKVIESQNTENNGKIILKKIKYNEATKTYKGIMSPLDKDIELNATISFITNHKLMVVAKKAFMSKTLYFIRIR